jgi:hypothetical protein
MATHILRYAIGGIAVRAVVDAPIVANQIANGKPLVGRTRASSENLSQLGSRSDPAPDVRYSFLKFSEGSACNVQNRTVLRRTLRQSCGMKNNELTRAQMPAVPCPACGVAIGKRCILYSGRLRSQPHLLRKLAAVEALEKK